MLVTRGRCDVPVVEDRTDELQRLELLWEAPAAKPVPERSRRIHAVAEHARRRLGWLLALTWVAYLAAVILLAPPSQEPIESAPLWVQYLVAGLWLALPLAAIGGLAGSSRLGFAASLAASGMAVALSIACTTTGHHSGSWWLYELAGSVSVGALSVAGLERNRRAARPE
jgi:peptidoglycan/LPS O-acetylase OafA/YrhL